MPVAHFTIEADRLPEGWAVAVFARYPKAGHRASGKPPYQPPVLLAYRYLVFDPGMRDPRWEIVAVLCGIFRLQLRPRSSQMPVRERPRPTSSNTTRS